MESTEAKPNDTFEEVGSEDVELGFVTEAACARIGDGADEDELAGDAATGFTIPLTT